jgi:hypothetical protein
MKYLLIPALIALAAQPAAAATNLGFEDGTTTGWASSGSTGATTANGVFTPQMGNWFGIVFSGNQDVYSTLSQTVFLQAGKSIRGFVGFQTDDYLPFDDDGYLTVNGTPLFTASVASVGAGGNTGWVPFRFIAPTAGSYTLELGVANRGDGAVSSIAVLDTAVPEPATWALLITGFGMVGFAARSRNRGAASTAS